MIVEMMMKKKLNNGHKENEMYTYNQKFYDDYSFLSDEEEINELRNNNKFLAKSLRDYEEKCIDFFFNKKEEDK